MRNHRPLKSNNQTPIIGQAQMTERTSIYAPGDYVKVEFPDETTGVGEWMWVRVRRCDDARQLVFGVLDNEPLGDYNGQVELGTELAISYARIRDHKKASEFKIQ